MYLFRIVAVLFLLYGFSYCAARSSSKGLLKEPDYLDMDEKEFERFLTKTLNDHDALLNKKNHNAIISDPEAAEDSLRRSSRAHKSLSSTLSSKLGNKLLSRLVRNSKIKRRHNRRGPREDHWNMLGDLENAILSESYDDFDDDYDDDADLRTLAALAALEDERLATKKRTAVKRWPLKNLKKLQFLTQGKDKSSASTTDNKENANHNNDHNSNDSNNSNNTSNSNNGNNKNSNSNNNESEKSEKHAKVEKTAKHDKHVKNHHKDSDHNEVDVVVEHSEAKAKGSKLEGTKTHEAKAKAKGSDPHDGNYILVPDVSQVLVVKNVSLTEGSSPAVPMSEHYDNVDPMNNHRLLTMTIQSHGPHFAEKASSSRESHQIGDTQACKGVSPKEIEENEEYQTKRQPDDLGAHSQDDHAINHLKKIKEEIVNVTTSGLDKYLKLLDRQNDVKSPNLKVNIENWHANSTSAVKDPIGGSSDPMMNVNITINGLLLNREKSSKIHGNGTIKVHPNAEDDRQRRELKIFKKLRGMKRGRDVKGGGGFGDKLAFLDGEDEGSANETCCDPDSGKPESGLTPEKLSNEIVKMVSHMVRSNPHMKKLWPSLKTNCPPMKSTGNQLRTTADCSGRKKIEEMLRKAMAAVNDIIKKEVQSRSCVPLSPDLADFYEVILEMHAKQAKHKEEREERLIQAENVDKESTDDDEKDQQPCKRKKCKHDPAELIDSADFGLVHLQNIKLSKAIEDVRRRRETEKRTQQLIMDTSNSSLVRNLRKLYSPAFLKLNNVVDGIVEADAVLEPEIL